MFGLGFLGKLGALASSVARAWSPFALWPDGIATPGMWISPRDLTSQWQDYLGTTPVSVPGTVADSSNPVGLALDIRAGAPEVLGPELVTNGDFATDLSGCTVVGDYIITRDTSIFPAGAIKVVAPTGGINGSVDLPVSGFTVGKSYMLTASLYSPSSNTSAHPGVVSYPNNDLGVRATAEDVVVDGQYVFIAGATTLTFVLYVMTPTVSWGAAGDCFYATNISVREVPGNHMLQSTSAARPLLSAYDGQTLGPGDTYDSTGYPIFQLYDGVDDGQATAAFAAGTLIDGMDCLIAVRRDSAASCVAGLYNGVADATKFFGMAESASGSGCVGSGAGTPTVWVDNTQLTGGTAVTRGTLHTALTVGDWHILEFRNLDLSTWTAAGFGLYTGYLFPGPRGDVLLYPSTASTEDKDAARQWLADYYGVTLP